MSLKREKGGFDHLCFYLCRTWSYRSGGLPSALCLLFALILSFLFVTCNATIGDGIASGKGRLFVFTNNRWYTVFIVLEAVASLRFSVDS